MRFVSTVNSAAANFNSNNQNLVDFVTNDAVINFFGGKTSVDILDAIVSINDLDADTLRANFRGLMVDDDMVIEVNLEGKVSTSPAPSGKFGKVTVTRGGGLGNKEIAIVDGESTVEDILTASVADFFATTIEGMKGLNVKINDRPAAFTDILHVGDTVVFEAKKAGDKGAYHFVVVDADDNEKEISVDASYGQQEVSVNDVMAYCNNHNIFEEPVTSEDVMSIDDDEVPDRFSNIICAAALDNGATIVFTTYFRDEVEETSSISGVEAPGSDMARGVVGNITLKSIGGFTTLAIPVVNGVTTIKDVIISNKVLNAFNMSEEQALNLVAKVNGNPAAFEDVVYIGSTITLEARKSGDKGNR